MQGLQWSRCYKIVIPWVVRLYVKRTTHGITSTCTMYYSILWSNVKFLLHNCKFVPFNNLEPFTGWVVTWFLLGYTVRMFEYTVRTFWSNVGRFLYVFSSIPKKLYTIFQPTFSPIKRCQDSIFKLLTLSTNSVTNVVRTAYFQIQARSSPLKILWQSLYSK